MTRRALGALAADEQAAAWPIDPPLLWGNSFDGHYPTGPTFEVAVGEDDPISTTVNGEVVTGSGAPASNLLDWLRDHAGTKGVKEGCAEGECGACTVHLDGAAVMSCLVPAGRAHGAEVVTVEGLTQDGELHAVQQAFVECGAVQCGFCTPGLVVAASKLLEENADPTRQQVSAGLAGNLCRCTGYNTIHEAIRVAGSAGQ